MMVRPALRIDGERATAQTCVRPWRSVTSRDASPSGVAAKRNRSDPAIDAPTGSLQPPPLGATRTVPLLSTNRISFSASKRLS